MRFLIKTATTIVMFFFVVGIVFTVVETISFNLDYYDNSYKELGTAEDIGISHDELMNATDTLLSYMRGERDDMEVSATIDGVYREVFYEREKEHMVDVVALFNSFALMRNIAFIAAVIVSALLIYKKKALWLLSSFRSAVYAFILFLAGLGLWALIDFNSLWTVFHLVLFRNDLWLLDSSISIMINMFPLPFFYNMVTTILLVSASIIVVLFAIATLCRNIIVKKLRKDRISSKEKIDELEKKIKKLEDEAKIDDQPKETLEN